MNREYQRDYIDDYKQKGLRKQLVDSIRQKGITAENVLQAINNIPRHFFLDTAFESIAYEDRAFPIGEGQTISQPYTVAYQSQLLDIKPFEKVLEIGTGSAYQSCVLGELKANVYTIERQKKLFDLVKKFPFKARYPTLRFFYGDGYEGLPTYGPFDKILVTAAAPEIPEKLLQQLKTGGKMVIPVGEKEVQRMLRLTKISATEFDQEIFADFSFVPMLAGKNF
ncbi:protein-L-isoaspartate(D-aspartate) O-methyltransferase [Chitinophaga costaii]|uniref:Protein-L-isoaspartate O-methyltransferase n=1 Tax=Chitinophaga costaii TaxID=1335309 RepID=A0A1C4EQ64_9BACT|nr:protein-L-isoaspartate(D-aspartate) O-methyltransferase [Chitinophaga costaii]PUZ22515.1 protein-L-isoaspartate(D-aspartate) O-methyltransferase [Chitinophaga costaii]SCC45765.1 protein-L-isoaspartate(D-aspartate) O-methyltransferase [Chitinophaga costaii]